MWVKHVMTLLCQRNPVVFGPFPQSSDNVLHLGVLCAPQQGQHLLQGFPVEPQTMVLSDEKLGTGHIVQWQFFHNITIMVVDKVKKLKCLNHKSHTLPCNVNYSRYKNDVPKHLCGGHDFHIWCVGDCVGDKSLTQTSVGIKIGLKTKKLSQYLLWLSACQNELEDSDTGPSLALPVVGVGIQFLQSIECFGCPVELTHLKAQTDRATFNCNE